MYGSANSFAVWGDYLRFQTNRDFVSVVECAAGRALSGDSFSCADKRTISKVAQITVNAALRKAAVGAYEPLSIEIQSVELG